MKTMISRLLVAIFVLLIIITTVMSSNNIAAAASVKVFKDVRPSHTYYKEITKMAELGIISGYENGMFKPDAKIQKKHAAALMARAFPDAKQPNPQVAKDININHPYYKEIQLVLKAGMFSVDSESNFNPDAEVTRGEMAEALFKAYLLEQRGFNLKAINFSDVKDPYLKGATSALYDAKITTGYTDKIFKPNESLTRAHYAVFMYRAAEAIKDAPLPPVLGEGIDWKTRPKLSSQEAMDQADKENILKGGKESNKNEYGGLTKLSRSGGINSSTHRHIMDYLSVNEKEYLALLKRAEAGEFVLIFDIKGEPVYIFYHFKEDRYYVGA